MHFGSRNISECIDLINKSSACILWFSKSLVNCANITGSWGSRSDVSAALQLMCVDMWDTLKKSISLFSWGRVSPCHSCNRWSAAVSSRGPLGKVLVIPGCAPGGHTTVTSSTLLESWVWSCLELLKMFRKFAFLKLVTTPFFHSSIIWNLIPGVPGVSGFSGIWFIFSAKRAVLTGDTEQRHKQVKQKFQRWKGRVVCLRSNANARISKVQRLLFLHIEPGELISLLQFHYGKCWLQGRRAGAKCCCLSGPSWDIWRSFHALGFLASSRTQRQQLVNAAGGFFWLLFVAGILLKLTCH